MRIAPVIIQPKPPVKPPIIMKIIGSNKIKMTVIMPIIAPTFCVLFTFLGALNKAFFLSFFRNRFFSF
jgi:hypothetical protein